MQRPQAFSLSERPKEHKYRPNLVSSVVDTNHIGLMGAYSSKSPKLQERAVLLPSATNGVATYDVSDADERPRKRARLKSIPPESRDRAKEHTESRIIDHPLSNQPIALDLKSPISKDQSHLLTIDVSSIVDRRPIYAYTNIGGLGKVMVKCHLSIEVEEQSEQQGVATKLGESVILLTTSQIGSIETKLNERNRAVSTVQLPNPFRVETGQLFISKPLQMANLKQGTRNANNEPESGLLNNFRIKLRLGAIGQTSEDARYTMNWPPLNLKSHPESWTPMAQAIGRGAHLDRIILYAEMLCSDTVSEYKFMPLDMKLRAHSHPTPYDLKVRLTWSSPVVNVKDEAISHIDAALPEVPNVTWSFISSENSDLVEHVVIHGFGCYFCKRKLTSIGMLKRHIREEHWQYSCNIYQSETTLGWFVAYHPKGIPQSTPRKEPILFSDDERSTTVNDSDGSDHANRNSTSTRFCPSRQLVASNFEATMPSPQMKRKADIERTPLPRESEISETSFESDDSSMHDMSAKEVRRQPLNRWRYARNAVRSSTSEPSTPEPKQQAPSAPSLIGNYGIANGHPLRSIVVPITKRPLYHTVTRRVLVPGEPLSPPTRRADEAWRLQEHKDIVNDFSDVTSDEKDYILHWDTFMHNERITADCYLASALIRFLQINTAPSSESRFAHRSWFARRSSRRRIFGLHVTALLLREVIDANDVWTCTAMLREACSNTNELSDVESDPEPVCVVRGSTECICGKHVAPFEAIICNAKGCKRRFHHKKCVLGSPGARALKDWACPDCKKNIRMVKLERNE